ncbi:MAG: hypothetical protein Q4B67_07460, partial [Eubacteriales bacterium]|nr:hypothetical protein [Eubacteriales bacterium]
INNVAENTNNVVVNTASVIKAYSAAIIEKGFPNKKKPAMELNLLCEDEGITLLINDNCKGFLVTEHVDSAAMPVKSAEQYQVLGLNKTKVIIE